MDFSTVFEWLNYINGLHVRQIELGLERVRAVAERLYLLAPTCPVVIVGGTNGKGSVVAGLESVYRAAGYKVGAFTSPILFKHNEYVRINGVVASDADFCDAYKKIEEVRHDISLTPFEFHALAALVIFRAQVLDVCILEVGLGGRLDAVNILDADVAIVTSIDIDHTEWLGFTREAIAREKAGIFRTGRPAVCGDLEPPTSLLATAEALGTPLFCLRRDFTCQEQSNRWTWDYQHTHYTLPYNYLAVQNMSVVLMAVTLLQQRLPVTTKALEQGIAAVTLPARVQTIPGPITKVLDVAHNPAAVAWLAKCLKKTPPHGRTAGVFSMLGDKDIASSVRAIRDHLDAWYVAPLTVDRAAPLKLLQQIFTAEKIVHAQFFPSIAEAYDAALFDSRVGDRVVVFGSFHTVAEVMTSNQ